SWQSWLRGQTGGRGIRLDTYQGQLDVTFFRLATTSAVAAPRPVFAISTELAAAGFAAADKIYAVYYDGASPLACGDGAAPHPSEYLTGSDSRSGTSCTGGLCPVAARLLRLRALARARPQPRLRPKLCPA